MKQVTFPKALNGIAAKIHRADQTTMDLNAAINTYVRDPGRYGVAGRLESEGTEYALRVHGPGELPHSFSILAGEVVHHLRSVLDHLVVALVPPECARNTHQFPIKWSLDKLEKAIDSGNIAGVSARAERLIRDAQPYLAPDPSRHFLSVLHELDNTDKHRLLLVTTSAASLREKIIIGPNQHVAITRLAVKTSTISEEGGEIFRFTFAEAVKNPEFTMSADAEFSVNVVFNQARIVPDVPVVTILSILRDNVLILLGDFFAEFD